MESKEKKDLFYCYNEGVARHLQEMGLTPAFSGVNQRSQGAYWAFERGPRLDEGLDAWQKRRWHSKQEEPKHE